MGKADGMRHCGARAALETVHNQCKEKNIRMQY